MDLSRGLWLYYVQNVYLLTHLLVFELPQENSVNHVKNKPHYFPSISWLIDGVSYFRQQGETITDKEKEKEFVVALVGS